MEFRKRRKRQALLLTGLAAVLWIGFSPSAAASTETTTLNVEVTDAATGKPVYQAQLTLQFRERRKLRHAKWISYSAKTDLHGRCKFVDIPKGPIRLMVIAADHQTFGQDYQLKEDGQVIAVKLRKPQPVL